MSDRITETNLVGDIRNSGSFSAERANDFLQKLELLMEEYKIQKIDICWAYFREQKGLVKSNSGMTREEN